MSHHGHHGYPVTQQIRLERRKRAEEDLAEYNKRCPTLQAKLAALPSVGANKQRARLLRQIEEQKNKPAVKQTVKASEDKVPEQNKPVVKKYMKGKDQ